MWPNLRSQCSVKLECLGLTAIEAGHDICVDDCFATSYIVLQIIALPSLVVNLWRISFLLLEVHDHLLLLVVRHIVLSMCVFGPGSVVWGETASLVGHHHLTHTRRRPPMNASIPILLVLILIRLRTLLLLRTFILPPIMSIINLALWRSCDRPLLFLEIRVGSNMVNVIILHHEDVFFSGQHVVLVHRVIGNLVGFLLFVLLGRFYDVLNLGTHLFLFRNLLLFVCLGSELFLSLGFLTNGFIDAVSFHFEGSNSGQEVHKLEVASRFGALIRESTFLFGLLGFLFPIDISVI